MLLRSAKTPQTRTSRVAVAFSQAKSRSYATAAKKERILVTGALGQIGSELIPELKKRGHYCIASDIRPPPAAVKALWKDTPFRYLDVSNGDTLRSLLVEHEATMILHLSAKLSATAEKDPGNSFGVNVRAVENVLETARTLGLRVYAPSSIAAFGPTTPNLGKIVKDITVQRPSNIYGVAKVYLETLGEWYNYRYGVDFRCLRYPGILSSDTLPGGGTTDYAVEIFYSVNSPQDPRHADPKGSNPAERTYVSGVGPTRSLPMMYMPDCLKATCDFIDADNKRLTQRTYNVSAVSFNPEEISKALNDCIKKLGPATNAKPLRMIYKPDLRDSIAAGWPAALDDTQARKDWDWKPEYEMDALVKHMLVNIEKKLKSQ